MIKNRNTIILLILFFAAFIYQHYFYQNYIYEYNKRCLELIERCEKYKLELEICNNDRIHH